MNKMNNDFYIILGTYLAIFFLTIFFFNFLTSGLLLTYIRAKASRGKKVLIKIHDVSNTYFKLGTIDEGFIRFKDKAKKSRSYPINQGQLYRFLNIPTIELDDINERIINKFGNDTEYKYDGLRTDEFLQRAIERPEMKTLTKELIVGILILLGVIGVAVLIYYRTDLILKAIPKVGVL